MDESRGATAASKSIAVEILYGAKAIAVFMFGEEKCRRRIYYLAERHGFPVFRIGENICARKHDLRHWIDTKGQDVAAQAGMQQRDEPITAPNDSTA